MHLTELRLVAT